MPSHCSALASMSPRNPHSHIAEKTHGNQNSSLGIKNWNSLLSNTYFDKVHIKWIISINFYAYAIFNCSLYTLITGHIKPLTQCISNSKETDCTSKNQDRIPSPNKQTSTYASVWVFLVVTKNQPPVFLVQHDGPGFKTNRHSDPVLSVVVCNEQHLIHHVREDVLKNNRKKKELQGMSKEMNWITTQ